MVVGEPCETVSDDPSPTAITSRMIPAQMTARKRRSIGHNDQTENRFPAQPSGLGFGRMKIDALKIENTGDDVSS
jgi:hypothetical protein